MDRTPPGRKFVGELTKINDQLCYVALLHHELETTLERHAIASPNDFTPSVFPANPFASRIYRKAKELHAFDQQAKRTNVRMAVIVASEYALSYLEDVQALRAKLRPSIEDNIHLDAAENQAYEKLARWLPNPPNKGWFLTIGYFRHMRNSFAHAHDEPSKEFDAFAKNYSHSLNKFWKNGITELNGFDFKTAPSSLSMEAAFTVMNLLRICLRELDRMFASTLLLENVLEPAVSHIIATSPDLKKFPSKIASKARAKIAVDYGERFPRPLFEQSIEPILLKH